MSTDKKTLRKELLEGRRALTPDKTRSASRAIMERLEETIVFRDAETVLTYAASKDNEADTLPLIRRMLSKGIRVLLPVVYSGGILRWSQLLAMGELRRGAFGILEPSPAFRRYCTPPPDALCLTPGAGFTRHGYRIGYGGGYYDRFLGSWPGFSIGLAFDMQIIPPFQTGPHDVPVDAIVTETHFHIVRRKAFPAVERAGRRCL